MRSGKLRSILESKLDALYRITQNESVRKALIEYRERIIEKEIKVLLGKKLFFVLLV